MHRQHQDGEVRVLLAQSFRPLKASDSGHLKIQQHQINATGAHEVDGLLGRGGLGDSLKVILAVEEQAQA